jgi:hypothetical protein
LMSTWLASALSSFFLLADLTRRRLVSAAQLYVRKAHCNEIECLEQRVRPTVSKKDHSYH